VAVGEVHLDGAQGHEEGLGDLLVGVALAASSTMRSFGGGQRIAAGLCDSRPVARESQPVACVVDQCRGAAALGQIGALGEGLGGVGALAGSADGAAEVDQGAGVLEARAAGGERLGGFGERCLVDVVD
jgi:hypothetical protein